MTRLALLCVTQVTVLVWLCRLTGPAVLAAVTDPAGLAAQPLGSLLAAVLSALALLAAAWLLIGTVHDTAMAFAGTNKPGLIQGLAPQWIRRIISQAVGAAVVIGTLAGPAGAVAPGTPAAVAVDVGPDFTPPAPPADQTASRPPRISALSLAEPVLPPPPPAAVLPSNGPTDASPIRPAPAPTESAPTAPDNPELESAASEDPELADGIHPVAAGENLWVIARGRVIQDGQSVPTDRQVHAYWVRLIEANRDVLVSGNPDVILPGEQLILPGTVTTGG